MHYDGTAHAKDGTFTIKDLKTDEPVPLNKELSPQDFEVLSIIYPKLPECEFPAEANCVCKRGFERKSNGSCFPDCSVNDCDKKATCTNTEEGYECNCNDGYHGDGKSCIKNKSVLIVSSYDWGYREHTSMKV